MENDARTHGGTAQRPKLIARWREVRAGIFSWFAELDRDQQVFGIGDDFKFHNEIGAVKSGWLQWRASGYKHKPSKDEVLLRDPDWDSDLDLMETYHRMYENTSLPMSVFRARQAREGEVVGFVGKDEPPVE